MKQLAVLMVVAVLAGGQPVDNLQRQIADVDAQLKALRQRYTEGHPDVKAMAALLDGLRAQQGLRKSAQDVKQGGIPDNWWRHPGMVRTVGVTQGQQVRMENVYQQYRLQLIDLNAALEKEEVKLEPLVAADMPDEGKIAAQIDRVANARAELEKARGRMLLGIRMVLEPEQWRKLNSVSVAEANPILPTKRPALPTKKLPTKRPGLPVSKQPE